MSKKRDHFRCETLMAWGIIVFGFGLAMFGKLTLEFVGLCTTLFLGYKKKNSDNLKELLHCNNRQEKGEL